MSLLLIKLSFGVKGSYFWWCIPLIGYLALYTLVHLFLTIISLFLMISRDKSLIPSPLTLAFLIIFANLQVYSMGVFLFYLVLIMEKYENQDDLGALKTPCVVFMGVHLGFRALNLVLSAIYNNEIVFW